MELLVSHKFKYPSGKWRLYYKCTNLLFCTATHGAHPDGTPLGIPADHDTKQDRVAAHEALDRLMRARRWTRPQAYHWLRRSMGLTIEKAHIGRFSRQQCGRLISVVGVTLMEWTKGSLPNEEGTYWVCLEGSMVRLVQRMNDGTLLDLEQEGGAHTLKGASVTHFIHVPVPDVPRD